MPGQQSLPSSVEHLLTTTNVASDLGNDTVLPKYYLGSYRAALNYSHNISESLFEKESIEHTAAPSSERAGLHCSHATQSEAFVKLPDICASVLLPFLEYLLLLIIATASECLETLIH